MHNHAISGSYRVMYSELLYLNCIRWSLSVQQMDKVELEEWLWGP